MRFSLPMSGCAIAFALLAGCSASQNAATVPFSGASAQSSQGAGAAMDPHGITPLQLLELQAAGKLPSPVAPEVLKSMLANYNRQPAQLPHATAKGTVAVWATDQFPDALVGLSSTGKFVTLVDTDKDGSTYAGTVKVDHNQNVWVTKELNPSSDGGFVQEFSKDGKLTAGYSWKPSFCPPASEASATCYGFSYDSAVNANFVFSGAYVSYQDNTGSDFGSGIFKFTNGDPSGTPKYYPVSDYNTQQNCQSTACDQLYYLDVDHAGNVWFDFMVTNPSTGIQSSGLGELTRGGKVSIIKPAGTYGIAGGVYASNGGTVLNVTDQKSRKTYQYHLPVTAASKPFHIIGPTQADVEGHGGDPVAGGFNSTDSSVVFGDGLGWFDRCTVPTGKCKAIATIDLRGGGGSRGAAYTPSDK
jgi:hypothetical protein